MNADNKTKSKRKTIIFLWRIIASSYYTGNGTLIPPLQQCCAHPFTAVSFGCVYTSTAATDKHVWSRLRLPSNGSRVVLSCHTGKSQPNMLDFSCKWRKSTLYRKEGSSYSRFMTSIVCIQINIYCYSQMNVD